jgi:cyclopropane fatty-acyl-phospholipid synthase-like methyltransferase
MMQMSWDTKWEQLFRTRGWNKYPSEQVIGFVARNFFNAADRKEIKLLELGCAEGNNVWFMAREGFDAYGIDGSRTAIDKARERLRSEGTEAHLTTGDVAFLRDLFGELRFDAILDAGCLTCNRLEVVESVLGQVEELLKPGGKIFSIMIAEGTYGADTGQEVEPRTYTDIRDGALQGVGLCHFFTQEEIEKLFTGFTNVHVEYMMRSHANQQQIYKHWIVDGESRR